MIDPESTTTAQTACPSNDEGPSNTDTMHCKQPFPAAWPCPSGEAAPGQANEEMQQAA